MSFGLYASGFAIVIAGLIYGAYLIHIPAHWIAVGGLHPRICRYKYRKAK